MVHSASSEARTSVHALNDRSFIFLFSPPFRGEMQRELIYTFHKHHKAVKDERYEQPSFFSPPPYSPPDPGRLPTQRNAWKKLEFGNTFI